MEAENKPDKEESARAHWMRAATAAMMQRIASGAVTGVEAEELLQSNRLAQEQHRLLNRYIFLCGVITRYEDKLNRRQQQYQQAHQPERRLCRRRRSSRRRSRQSPKRQSPRHSHIGVFALHLIPRRRQVALRRRIVHFKFCARRAPRGDDHARTRHPDRDEAPMAELRDDDYVNALSADVWLQLTKVVKRELPTADARAELLRLLEAFQVRVIDEHRQRMRDIQVHYEMLIQTLGEFARSYLVTGSKKREAGVRGSAARRWLRNASRRTGVYLAVQELARPHGQQTALFERLSLDTMVDAFCLGADQLGDAAASALYECLEQVHAELASALAVVSRRITWLVDTPSTHACWSGLVVQVDTCDYQADEEILQAPAHVACFARGRVRVVRDAEAAQAPFSCPLVRVRVARLLAQLLEEKHLRLDYWSSSYARRLILCDFCKYEVAAFNVEQDTLVPFGKSVNVPYTPGAFAERIHALRAELRQAELRQAELRQAEPRQAEPRASLPK